MVKNREVKELMKRYHRYQMDFDSKASWFSGICMGLPIFLLAVYYLFMQEIDQLSIGKLILNLWIPVALSFGFLVLLRIVRWNAPGAFAIVGAAVCLLLIAQLFPTGNVLRIVAGTFCYIICGGLLILCAGGFLPGRMIASLAFLTVLLLRLLVFGRASGWAWLPEMSALSTIAGLMFLPVSFREGKTKK